MKKVHDIIKQLKTRRPLPPLVPDKIWDSGLSKEIHSLDAEEKLKAALFLWNDDLDGSHKIAQQISENTGSLIHAIMHRREPDYGNSKYWLRRVGQHPVFECVAQKYPDWEPFKFVDACENALGKEDQTGLDRLLTLQAHEMDCLTQYILRN